MSGLLVGFANKMQDTSCKKYVGTRTMSTNQESQPSSRVYNSWIDDKILCIAASCVENKSDNCYRGCSRGPEPDYTSTFNATVRIPFIKPIDDSSGYVAPLPIHRRIYLSQAMGEVAAFLAAHDNNNDFIKKGCTFWSPWAREDGSLGPIYGVQWQGQLTNAIKNSKNRRALVSAWNPTQLPDMALPPCHFAFQLHNTDQGLRLTWFQRSCDVAVGLPYNIVFYWTLCWIIAEQLGVKPLEAVGMLSDCHVYDNQIGGVEKWRCEWLNKREACELIPEPVIVLNFDNIPAVDNPELWKPLTKEDIRKMYSLRNYNPTSEIKIEVTV